jgi:hypothetical protein
MLLSVALWGIVGSIGDGQMICGHFSVIGVVFSACLSLRCLLRKLIRVCVQLRGRRMVELGHLSFTLFVLFALFTIKDLFIHSEPDAKEIPITRMVSSTFVGPTLKFLYW